MEPLLFIVVVINISEGRRLLKNQAEPDGLVFLLCVKGTCGNLCITEIITTLGHRFTLNLHLHYYIF